MRRRWLALPAAGAVAIGLVLLRASSVDLTPRFDAAVIGGDVDAYLAEREARFSDIVPGTAKRVVWAREPGRQTPLAVIYVHGFSATSEELRPVPDLVAARLGANLFFTRLAGHGRSGDALAGASAEDWLRDLDEALAIGRRIGRRMVLVGTSTGGTLAALAALDPRRMQSVAGIVLVSPNFGLRDRRASVLTWPGARLWLPLVLGEERGFAPLNADHARYWTSRYPTVAILQMARLVRVARRADFAAARVPALFVFSDDDRVVSPAATRDVAARWGGPAELVTLRVGPGDDPASHVIAGDILSPGQTERVAKIIADWIGALGR